MSVNIVLKLGKGPEIPGESVIDKHVGEIDCLAWGWGMTQSGSAHMGSGGGTGTADVRDLTIVKLVDKASPNLLYHCWKGKPVGDSILTCIKVGGDNKVEYIKITMSDTVMISSINTGEREVVDGKSTDRFVETITLHFSKVNFEYTTQTKDNKPDKTIPSNEMNIATT